MKKIGFITHSDEFDQLIKDFRRAHIDAAKRDVKSPFEHFDILVVDLSYPLENAYPFLEKINSDYRYSETIVIASVSSKNQLAKIRSLALGCHDYISPKITFTDLHRKIQEWENPEKSLLKKDFHRLRVSTQFEGSLSHISENGCLIKSKVSLNREKEQIKIKSKLIADFGLSREVLFHISRSNPIAKRSFVTEIHFQNMTDEDREKIRKVVKEWSVQ